MSTRAEVYNSTFKFFRMLRKLGLLSKKKFNVRFWLLIKKLLKTIQ